ncbi:MAG: DUF6057 family protein [Prevotella sp.]|nr:DUF6057 family protein [Prevotella sp.]
MKPNKQNKKTKPAPFANTPQKASHKQQTKKGKEPKVLTARQLKWPMMLIPLIALIVVGAALVCYESDFLFRVQEMDLFLYTPLFFKQQLVVSGGFLTYLGTYFTQYFYHPWIGVAMLCLWWLLLMWLLKQTFNIPVKWTLLLLVPIALLIIINVDLGYWIYYLKLRGNFFVATIGTAVAVALAWAYRALPRKFFLRTIFIVIATVISYPLFGFYGLLAALLMAVLAWRLDDYNVARRSIDTVVALAAIGLVPLAYYYGCYYQTNIINIYYTALPLYRISEDHMAYYIPFYLLVTVLVAFAACYRRERQPDVKRRFPWLAAQVLLLAALVAGVYHFWYKDENFHTELALYNDVENHRWEEVLTTYRDHDSDPSRMMWMMKNLALARLGRQADEMYCYKNGDRPSDAPFTARMAQFGGKQIYYNYGLINYCYRWCLEDGVEYGWCIEYYKFMLKCSILNGEMTVAQKYIDILSQTKYYRDYAQQFEQYVKNPSLVAKNEEFSTIKHLMPPYNELTSDQSLIEIFLIDYFANRDSDDPKFEEQSMIFALQTKDIPTFWNRFFRYAKNMEQEGKHMPKHIQEAAFLYGNLENKIDISKMPFDKEIVDTYNEFMAAAQQYRGMSEAEMKPLMYNRFGSTFYFEYFFTRDQRSY